MGVGALLTPVERKLKLILLSMVLTAIAFGAWSVSVPGSAWQRWDVVADNPTAVGWIAIVVGLLFGAIADPFVGWLHASETPRSAPTGSEVATRRGPAQSLICLRVLSASMPGYVQAARTRQAVERSGLRGQVGRCRRAVPGSAGAGGGVLASARRPSARHWTAPSRRYR